MPTIQCPSCRRTVNYEDKHIGKRVRCPKCGSPIRIPAIELPPLENSPTPESDAPFFTSIEFRDDPSQHRSDSMHSTQPEFSRSRRPKARERFIERFRPSSNLLNIFDISFKHYVTPIIIRISWIIVLGMAALFLLMQLLSLFDDIATGLAQSDGQRTERSTSVDDESPFSRLGGRESRKESKFTAALSNLFWRAVKVVAVILSVLWSRVTLEMFIVVFNIATTLHRIESRSANL